MIIINKIEKHFKFRFRINYRYLNSVAPSYSDSSFCSQIEFKILDTTDGKEHKIKLPFLIERELISNIRDIIRDKRNDSIDNIIDYYGE
jgi:hypothetical protein